MSQEKKMICICCPIGCHLTVDLQDNGDINVSGNNCPRGEKYAKDEIRCPKRMVTTIVRVDGGIIDMVSVKSADGIPKGKIFDVLEVLKGVRLTAPIKIGDIVVSNICDTGIDIIATKNIKKK